MPAGEYADSRLRALSRLQPDLPGEEWRGGAVLLAGMLYESGSREPIAEQSKAIDRASAHSDRASTVAGDDRADAARRSGAMRLRLFSPFLLRRLLRSLDRIGSALEAQTELLAILTARFAPEAVAASPAEPGDVSFADAEDIVLGLRFVEQTRETTGHTPSDEEVLEYLADEKTRDLQERLNQRAEALKGLQQ
jgi:hypothetical protein